jgi:hypothetical protein
MGPIVSSVTILDELDSPSTAAPGGRIRSPPPMRSSVVRLALLLCVVLLGIPGAALAGEPPNQDDPCSAAGRNTCGTTGVGSYERYRYGIRWFGDYRGAVPGTVTFCVDLRYWYPAPRYGYEPVEDLTGFRNRDGEAVPQANLRRMAHAVWNHGRSGRRDQQAAVMLYVHSLMGDGAPGEAAPDAIGPAVGALVRRIAADADRHRGPYRVQAAMPSGLVVGRPATATVRIVSATGAALPGTALTVRVQGGTAPASVRTDGAGVARVRVTPTATEGLSLTVTSAPVASTQPRILAPTRGAAVRNGQRLVAPASQRVATELRRDVAPLPVAVTTRTSRTTALVGQGVRDRLRVTGLPPGRRLAMTVLLHGPYRSAAEAVCTGEPVFRGTAAITGSGTVQGPVVTPTRPGVYTWQVVIPDGGGVRPLRTPCGVPAETFTVQVQPRARTQASSLSSRPGAELTDLVVVEGLAGETTRVDVALHGPFPTRQAISCDTPPVWSGSVTATGDGEYRTAGFTPTVPGYYTYRESIPANGFVRAQTAPCGEVSETPVVMGTPVVTTRVSAQRTRPGASVTDAVSVSGLGVLEAPATVSLHGPFPTREAVSCTGTPVATRTITLRGDGTTTSPAVRIPSAGHYTYVVTIAGTEAYDPVVTACGDPAETTVAEAQPAVVTTVSDEVVRPGSRISDRLRVTGLGDTRVEIDLELFGPFPTRAAMRCTGTPHWRGTVVATGDGTYRSAPATVRQAGFYTYRERIAGGPLVRAAEGACGAEAETSLSAPAISTGRTAPPAGMALQARAAQGGPVPTRVRVPGLGIDAPVTPSVIDVARGELAVPVPVARTGWWRDGAAPGDRTGTVLIAGHVDSARAGAGAFFRLKDATSRDRVQVVAGGRTRVYRVVSVRSYLKAALPLGVFTRRGAARLVLVTCGGPFLPAVGHYRDNVVLTAVPA